MKEIIMASGNKGKIKEAQEILNEYKIVSKKELGIDIDVEENEKTFMGNAVKKAEEIANEIAKMQQIQNQKVYVNTSSEEIVERKLCIADDSGIEIDYLDGFPGVYTKRWHEGSDRDRNLAIIEKLKGVSKENRKVKFITAIAISDGIKTISEEAVINGYIVESPRGDNGFGFDEIFELENGKTLAELTQDEKNQISARRKALEIIKRKI